MTGFDFEDLEREEVRVHKPIVLHEDAEAAALEASGPTDEILWHGDPETARCVAFFGPGALARPLLGRVAAAAQSRQGGPCWEALENGLRADFGGLDPACLREELLREDFEEALRAASDGELRKQVAALQDWHLQALGRLRTMERRAAWALLGIPATSDQKAVARAFKRRALELHPDKGGDAARFQLLQELKELLLKREPRGRQEQEEVREAAGDEGNPQEEANEEEQDSVSEEEKEGPDLKKEKGKEPESEEEDVAELLEDGDFCRERYEAVRCKLRRAIGAIWERTGRLAAELKPGRAGGGRALREFRSFAKLFTEKEVQELRRGDEQRAEVLLHRFLEFGAEMLCAAGALAPVAAVAELAGKVTGPLLAAGEKGALRRLCGELLAAVEGLAAGCRRYSAGLEALRDAQPEPPQEESPEEESPEETAEQDEPSAEPEAVPPEPSEPEEAPREPEAAPAPEVAPAAEAPAVEAPKAAPQCQELVPAPQANRKCAEQRLQPLRKKWDLFWDHPCAGDRRSDGSGIFCCACDAWVLIPDVYDHEVFEAHCLQDGHENWIYGRLGEHAPALGY